MHRTNYSQAKLGLDWFSWHPAQFLPPVLTQRSDSTPRFVPQQEIAHYAQVQKSAANKAFND